jgi:alpha-mannosidase
MGRLNDAWTLVMGGQFHDILPGTSLPSAYQFSWNDETVALNQFAGVLAGAAKTVGSALDTQAVGTPVIVYNPLNIAREDIVEAAVPFAGATPASVRVVGPDGLDVPAQIGQDGKVVFLAKVPSVGFAVYDVQAADAAKAGKKPVAKKKGTVTLTVTESSMENGRYRLKLDANGDIASLFDKVLNKELLSAPIRLAFKGDKPVQWPAWNMDWADQQKAPRAFVQGPATVKIVENGPARVALQVSRQAEGSTFVETIRLAAGDAGNRVELANAIDWKTAESNLKATFPLVAANPMATYNWDIGTIDRSTDEPNKYEVPTHQWLDLTDKAGTFGVTVLTDAKYGSDKPDENTLRLTLLRTPGISKGWEEYEDQSSQDWGHHEFVYGVASHAGDWRKGQTDWQAWRLNTPLAAFTSAKHTGTLGKRFSLMGVSSSRVRALAVTPERNEVSPARFILVMATLMPLVAASLRLGMEAS